MAMNFRTQHRRESSRDYNLIAKDLEKIANRVVSIHSEFRITASKCIAAKNTLRYIDKMNSTKEAEKNPKYESILDTIKKNNPTYTPHDIYAGIENVLTDYAKKVATFATTMVTTVRQYSVGLFDLFTKKLRINKSIDTSKFIGIDSSMSLVVMTYDDYCNIGHPIVEKSGNVVKEVQSWFASLGRIKKALNEGDQTGIQSKLKELTKKINEGMLITFLKEHELAEFQFGVGFQNGNEGLIKIDVTDKFKNLEQSRILNQCGWDDVDKLKNSLVLQNVEAINKNINNLYKMAIDLMDEVRRISNEHCVKEPYVCASLVKYASLVAQMVNCYTKSFDMCWTTCLRVSQACLVEG